MLKYGTRVMVTSGFFEGRTGILINKFIHWKSWFSQKIVEYYLIEADEGRPPCMKLKEDEFKVVNQ